MNIIYDSNINPLDKCNPNNHEYCCKLRDYLINNIITKNNIISDNLIKRIFKIMQDIECWSLQYEINIDLIKFIYSNYKLSLELQKTLFCNLNNELIELYFSNNKNQYNTQEEINEIFFMKSYNAEIIQKTLINQYSNNNVMLKLIFNSIIESTKYNLLDLLFEHKVDISYDDFIKCISLISLCQDYQIDYRKFFDKLIQHGGQILKSTMIDFFNYLIKFYKECNNNRIYNYFKSQILIFLEIFIENNCDMITFNHIKFFLQKYDSEPTLKYNFKFDVINNAINLLFDAGMKLTKMDVAILIRYDISIKNYSKLDFPIDCDEIAIQQSLYKKKIYKIKEKYTLEILRNYCKSFTKIDKIKQICETITPDIICLENACTVRNNDAVIRYLCSNFNIKINDKCILNLLKNSDSSIANYIVYKYLGQEKTITS